MNGANTAHPDCSILDTDGTSGSYNKGTLDFYAGDVQVNGSIHNDIPAMQHKWCTIPTHSVYMVVTSCRYNISKHIWCINHLYATA